MQANMDKKNWCCTVLSVIFMPCFHPSCINICPGSLVCLLFFGSFFGLGPHGYCKLTTQVKKHRTFLDGHPFFLAPSWWQARLHSWWPANISTCCPFWNIVEKPVATYKPTSKPLSIDYSVYVNGIKSRDNFLQLDWKGVERCKTTPTPKTKQKHIAAAVHGENIAELLRLKTRHFGSDLRFDVAMKGLFHLSAKSNIVFTMFLLFGKHRKSSTKLQEALSLCLINFLIHFPKRTV